MALVILGKTPCLLCGKTLGTLDKTVAFPAFLPKTHPLSMFSDGAFHEECFLADERNEAVNALYRRYRSIWDARPRELKTLEEMEAWGREAFKDFP